MRVVTRVVLSIAVLSGCNARPAEPKPDAPDVVRLAAHDVSPPLREMAKIAMAKPHVRDDDESVEAEVARRVPLPHMRYDGVADPVVQRAHVAPLAPIAAPSVSFEGLGAGLAGFQVRSFPPDTDGAIGDNDYFQVVNTGIAVFSRAGAVELGPVDTSTLWMGFNGACATTNDGDATIRYDHIAKRWVVAQFSLGANFQGPFFQCVAVSTTSDPTGTYARYQFDYDALNDYPKVGLWPDAYYFTFNMFPDTGFAGGKVCAMDRVKMLAGDPTATMQCFDAGANFGGLLASDVDGKTLPPPGAPNYVVALDSNTTLAYWQLHVDFTTPANSTFTGPTSITVASFTPVCSGGTCVPQPGTTKQLDSLADRAMNRFVYRRFADHESLMFSHSVVAGTSGGVRWYELRTPNTPTVFQQGTFAPDATFRWLPSLGMDGAGDIALIYTNSSSTISPSIHYTARVPSDTPGTMGQGEGLIVAGTGNQTQFTRWGDYSSLNIDPTNDCTFWGTHEYEVTGGSGSWSTRVAAFQLPGCASFDVTTDAEMVDQGAMKTFPVTTATTAGNPQSVALTVSGLPVGVTATLTPTTVMSGSPTMITLTAASTAALGLTHYTLTGTGATSSAMVDVALTIDPAMMADAGSTGDDDGGKVSGGCCGVSRGTPFGSLLLGAAVLLGLRRRRRVA